MAPELTRPDPGAKPDAATDRHALAVLLFYLLTLHHPLKGQKEEAVRCLDFAAKRKLYGREPLFVFDPADDSNRPDPRHHKAVLALWPLYPRVLQALFTRAFTAGLSDPGARVTETQWMEALVRYRDALYPCADCGAEIPHDAEAVRESGGPPRCWGCGSVAPTPMRLRVGREVVALSPGVRLHAHHLDPARRFDFGVPLAEVAAHPAEPGRLGLKNLSTEKWALTAPGGPTQDVPPGRAATLANGSRLHFGRAEGEVRA